MKLSDFFYLLDKKTLTAEEKEKLEKFFSENRDADKIARIYRNVKEAAAKGSHLDTDIIAEYVLYKNNSLDEPELLIRLLPKIENHLRECKQCETEFKLMMSEYESVNDFINKSITSTAETTKAKDSGLSLWQSSKQKQILKSVVYSFAAILLIYFSVFAVVNLSTPSYKKDLVVFDGGQKFVTRGRVTTEFQKGIAELDKHHFEKAIENLKKDIQDHPGDKTIFYTYFILGKTYLESAKYNVLGLFENYDEEKIENAIDSFKKSIEKNTAPEFEHLNLDSYYYIARALLLLDRKDEAIKYLKIVIDKKGSFKNEAEEILSSLKS